MKKLIGLASIVASLACCTPSREMRKPDIYENMPIEQVKKEVDSPKKAFDYLKRHICLGGYDYIRMSSAKHCHELGAARCAGVANLVAYCLEDDGYNTKLLYMNKKGEGAHGVCLYEKDGKWGFMEINNTLSTPLTRLLYDEPMERFHDITYNSPEELIEENWDNKYEEYWLLDFDKLLGKDWRTTDECLNKRSTYEKIKQGQRVYIDKKDIP